MNKQEYLLACLAEECSEITKSAMKASRFGMNDHYPDKPIPTNKESIEQECVDLIGVMALMLEEGIINLTNDDIMIGAQKKKEKLLKFMEYSRQTGNLID